MSKLCQPVAIFYKLLNCTSIFIALEHDVEEVSIGNYFNSLL